MKVRRRNPETGQLQELEPYVPGAKTPKEELEAAQQLINVLGAQLTQEKLTNMSNTSIITALGMQLTQTKLDIMLLKGGA